MNDSTYTLEICEEITVKAEVEYSWSPVDYGDNWTPPSGGIESINAVWIDLPDKNGNKVSVDISELLDLDYVAESLDEELTKGDDV
jgi:hypothetical protein